MVQEIIREALIEFPQVASELPSETRRRWLKEEMPDRIVWVFHPEHTDFLRFILSRLDQLTTTDTRTPLPQATDKAPV